MPTKLIALIAAVGALIVSPLSAGPAHAEKRVALVIGNGVYENVAKLSNPIKDAAALADMFRKAGFDWVGLKSNVSKLEFNRALRQFMDAAQDADVAVLYYAGHGIQVRDMNYMIPVDARLATEIDAEDEAVSLDRIAMALEPAKRLRLIILDACRDNPFDRTMKRRVASRAVAGGLAKMEPVLPDTLIAYAAKAGSLAEDGAGENSPFAAALVKHLSVPGLDIRVAFGRVRDDVLKRTANRQEPFVYGSLGGDSIALVPAPAPPPPKVEVLGDAKSDYELVERVGTEGAWEAFLATHKEGLYADLARAQLAKIKRANEARSLSMQRSPAAEPAPSVKPGSQNIAQEAPAAAEGKAARQREEATRVAKAAPQDGTPRDDTCLRDGEKLARLRGSLGQGWAREDLKRLQQVTTCDRVRSEAVALLSEVAAPIAKPERAASETPPANTPARQRTAPAEAEAEAVAGDVAEGESTRAGAARLAQSMDRGRTSADDACSRDDEKLARLRGSLGQGWAREDLKRLQQVTTCERVRAGAVALLAELSAGEAGQFSLATGAQANSPELVLSVQRELQRLGCFNGEADGRPGEATMAAIRRYLAEKGRSSGDVNVTDSLIAELRAQSTRVCPLACARGEHVEGDRCVADAKPERQRKGAAKR